MNIQIFSCDSKENFLFAGHPKIKEQLEETEKTGITTKINFLSNNSLSLTVAYNKFLDDIRENHKDTDYVILMHSDVAFDYAKLISTLEKLGDKYDLIGFAGTKKAKISQSPLTWFTGSIPFPEERFGKIAMKTGDNLSESFYNEKNPDVTDTRVALVDGLCLILNKKMLESDIRFDERFGNDFYDSDFCLQCLKNYDFKIGVIVMPVVHLSVGESVKSKQFLGVNKDFCEKWGIEAVCKIADIDLG